MHKMRVKLFCKFIIILCWFVCGMCEAKVPANSFNQSTEVNQTRQAKCKQRNHTIQMQIFIIVFSFFFSSKIKSKKNVTKFLNDHRPRKKKQKLLLDCRVSILHDRSFSKYTMPRKKSIARNLCTEWRVPK